MAPFDPRLLSPLSRNVRTDCPECRGSLAVMRVIPGRAGFGILDHALHRCGGIHLDIVNPASQPATRRGVIYSPSPCRESVGVRGFSSWDSAESPSSRHAIRVAGSRRALLPTC